MMGRGHSGSTILDIVAGNHREIESVGEFISGATRINSEICSCSDPVKACIFWSKIELEYKNITGKDSFWVDAKLLARYSHVKYFCYFLFSSKSSVKIKNLIKVNSDISESISRATGKPFMLDSSKEITRALFLARFLKKSKILYLIRDPEEVFASSYKRYIKGDSLKFLRVRVDKPSSFFAYSILLVAAWSVSVFLSLIVRLLSSGKFKTIFYSDLIEKPQDVLGGIDRFIDSEDRDLILSLRGSEGLDIGHNIGGNKIRYKKKIHVENKKSQYLLPFPYKILVAVVNKPIWWILRLGGS